MPSPMARPATEDRTAAAANGTVPAVVVPFVRASDENIQSGGIDVSNLMTANPRDLGVFDVPAYGYVRWLYLLVTAEGGAQGAAAVAATEDAPFNILQNIALTEPNGAFIASFANGYELFLANKYGGYLPVSSADPRNSPAFSDVDASGDFQFLVRVPVELSGRDGVGSLPNQDSAGQFKLRATLAGSNSLYSVAPATTLPTVRVRAWLSAWDQPETSSAGMANATEPPGVGTTSFWSVQSGIAIAQGENTVELKRRGNYLRQIIFILRDAAGSRVAGEAAWPDETRFMRDAFPARYYQRDVWRHMMFERTGYSGAADDANTPENGVRFHDYAHEFSGSLGYENRDLWQPTRGSTRLEIAGNFGAATRLDILTNDVAIAQNVFL